LLHYMYSRVGMLRLYQSPFLFVKLQFWMSFQMLCTMMEKCILWKKLTLEIKHGDNCISSFV
jgi:hypothetical protein